VIRLEEIRTLLFGDCIPTKGTQSGGWVDCDGPNGPHFGTPISEAPLDQDDKGQQYSYSSADLEGLQGFAEAAVADAWGATKSALKKARAAHGGGQEASIVDEVKKTHANYIIPSGPSERDAAIDAITADFAALKKVDERWWFGPPDSRWCTGMESAQQKKPPENQS
jgi:hypothetical protein